MRRSQVAEMAQRLQDDQRPPVDCPARLRELARLMDGASREPCAEDEVAATRSFQMKFMAARDEARLPLALRRLLLAFGLQLQAACRRKFLANFEATAAGWRPKWGQSAKDKLFFAE